MKSIAVLSCAVCLVALTPGLYGQRLSTLYSIPGEIPAGLTGTKEVLYGATRGVSGDGPGSCGTVFELLPPVARGDSWTPIVLYSFVFGVGGPDACQPMAAPLVASDGTLFGVTSQGGVNPPPDFGALYAVNPPATSGGTWSEDVLYSFGMPGSNISTPATNIVPGPGGSFYVLTSTFGLCQLHPPASPGGPWTATVPYSFPTDGQGSTSLVAGPNGILYGTTHDSAFRLKPPATPGGAWTETVLHAFYPSNGPAGNPIALTVAGNGTLYGTAYGNDPPLGGGESTIFQLTPPSAAGAQWTYANLTVPTNTEHFNTPVVIANGRLYGGITTGTGGSIYELLPPSSSGGDWTLTTLYTFTNGQIPSGNLVAGEDGTIYGTTAAAPGQPSGGTVFAITKN